MHGGYSSKKEWLIWAVFMRFAVLRWIARRTHQELRQWLLILPIMVMLSGCATLLTVAQDPLVQSVVKRGVEYGVIKFLSTEPDRQPVALEIVDYLEDKTDQSAELTIKDLENLAMDKIPWFKMSVDKQYTLRRMIEDISGYLQDRVGEGELSENDKVELGEFFGWMKKAIIFAGR